MLVDYIPGAYNILSIHLGLNFYIFRQFRYTDMVYTNL